MTHPARGPCRTVLPAMLAITLAWIGSASNVRAQAPDDYPVAYTQADFQCGGLMESNAWAFWDDFGLAWLEDEWMTRVLQRDAYALYEMQSYFHNAADMAYRCHRFERLTTLADTLMPAYDMLEPVDINGRLDGPLDYIGWICGSGANCPSSHDQEVFLVSVQGLGFFTGIARYMVDSTDPAVRAHPFVAMTMDVAISHALRWGRAENLTLFYDKELWLETIIANIAGIARVRPELLADLPTAERDELLQTLQTMLDEHADATQLAIVSSPHLGGSAIAAETGADPFWAGFYSFQWAGYAGDRNHPPVDCDLLPADPVLVPPAPVSPLGWDFSHAERIVPATVALQLNARALQERGIGRSELQMPQLAQRYAAQIVATIWNGDLEQPLFSNWWNGVNGWIDTVAPPDGCSAGWWPSFFSMAYILGGYAQWGEHYPVLTQLARNIYWLSQSDDVDAGAFVEQWYDRLRKPVAGNDTRKIGVMAFWPVLVQSDSVFADGFE